MSVDNTVMMGVDSCTKTLEDDDAENTGTLFLTVDCCEEPPLQRKRKAETSSKTAEPTQKVKVDTSENDEVPLTKKQKKSADGKRKKKTGMPNSRPSLSADKMVVMLDSEGQKRYSCELCDKSYTQVSLSGTVLYRSLKLFIR